jgi:CHASE2 domain-containing sensor protein
VSRLRTLLVSGILAVAVIAGASATGTLQALEHDSVDMRFQLREDEPPTDVVVVAVDDVTFSDLRRQWPFPRTYFAKVTDRLHDAGAKEIVFDIQFTEQTKPAEDWALYDAVDRAGGAVFATSETDGKGGHNVLGGEKNLRAIGATAAASNLPDEDSGVIRRFSDKADDLPTIAAAVAARRGRPVDPKAFTDGNAWIDFRGGPRTVPTVSFSDVYQARANPELFAGKIVVVGASAPTLQDVHPTSTARRELMSGPEIQANAIWTALHGVPLRNAPDWVGLLAIALLSLFVPLAALRFHPLAAALTGLLAGAGYIVVTWLAFRSGVVMIVVAPLIGLAVATLTGAVAGHLLERRARRRIAEYSAMLEQAVRERTADLDALQVEIIERLGQAVDSRDNDTGEHIRGIGTLSYKLGRAVGLDEDRAEMLRRASAMHDVGKIAIPDAILQHPGPLNAEQWAIMKTHTTEGAKILAGSRSPLVRMAEIIALTHHEKWDGNGYPHGISGEDIPLEGRIVALCDVYDALVSERPYKKPWTHEEALAEIEKCAGTHFDPVVAEAFLRIMGEDDELRARAPQPVAVAQPA